MLAPTKKLRFYIIVGATIGRPKDKIYFFYNLSECQIIFDAHYYSIKFGGLNNALV